MLQRSTISALDQTQNVRELHANQVQVRPVMLTRRVPVRLATTVTRQRTRTYVRAAHVLAPLASRVQGPAAIPTRVVPMRRAMIAKPALLTIRVHPAAVLAPLAQQWAAQSTASAARSATPISCATIKRATIRTELRLAQPALVTGPLVPAEWTAAQRVLSPAAPAPVRRRAVQWQGAPELPLQLRATMATRQRSTMCALAAPPHALAPLASQLQGPAAIPTRLATLCHALMVIAQLLAKLACRGRRAVGVLRAAVVLGQILA